MLSPEVASPASQPLSHCQAYSSLLVPAAVIKHGLKAPLGGEGALFGLWLTVWHLKKSRQALKVGTWKQELKQKHYWPAPKRLTLPAF